MKRSDCIVISLNHNQYVHYTEIDGTHMFRNNNYWGHTRSFNCVCGPRKVIGPGIYSQHKEKDNIFWVHKHE